MSTFDDRSYEYTDKGKVKFNPFRQWQSVLGPAPWQMGIEDQRRKIKSDIESGWVDPNSVNEDGAPLWHCICQRLDDDDVDWVTSLFYYEQVQIDARDNFGRTALHLAVYNDLERITEFLLSLGANPNLANDRGETPLHVICRIDKYLQDGMYRYCSPFNRGHPTSTTQFILRQERIIELLLRRGADPNAADAKGFTPLHVVCQKKCDDDYVRSMRTMYPAAESHMENVATYRNYQSVIERMLRGGANPNLTNDKEETPLHIVSKGYGDNHRLAEMLFQLGDERYGPVLVDPRDANGETPLHLALRESNEQLVQWLLRRGADRNLANSKGVTPLHVICQGDRDAVGLARMIMSRSDDDDRRPRVQIDTRDNSNNAPLHLAASRGHIDLINFLLDNGANPTLVNDKGETPLHLICWNKCVDDYKRVEIRMVHPRGLTLARLTRNYQSAIESMLRRGADPTVANAKGSTPLHLICNKGLYADEDRDLAETLFEFADERYRPIPVDARNIKGDTPLHLATNKGHNELVDFLLRRGVDPNLANDEGETPLHIICRRGDVQMLRLFFDVNQQVDKVVQVDEKDKLGRTPFEWAVTNYNLDMIDVLLDRGADLYSFVFPVERHFYEKFRIDISGKFSSKLEAASGIMMVVEHLESKGYKLELSDALTIMTFFANHGLFEESPSHWMRNKKKNIQLLPKLANKFFRTWALHPFQQLIHYRLPEEMCVLIIETLTNKDLYHIFLAAEGQTDEDGKINVITNVKKRNNERPVRAKIAPKRLKIER